MSTLASAIRPLARAMLWLESHGVAVIVLLALVVYGLSYSPVLPGTDASVYLVTARALADGAGYCKANLTGCPPETYYPPGFPAVLSLLVRLVPPWPDSVPWLTFIPLAFAVAAIPLVYQSLRKELECRRDALLLTFAVAVNYVATWFTSVLLSETLYLLVSVAALWLLHSRSGRQRRVAPVIKAGLLVGSLILVRSVGITLLIAACFVLLLRKELLQALVLGCTSLLIFAPYQARTLGILHSEQWEPHRSTFIQTYADTFLKKHWQDATLGTARLQDFLLRPFTNARGHVTETVPKLLFPTLQSPRLVAPLSAVHLRWLPHALVAAIVCVAVIGFLWRIRQRLSVLDCYVFCYVGMILLPRWYTVRNLVPILPFIYLYLLQGGRVVGQVVRRLMPTAVGVLIRRLGLVLVISSVGSNLLSQFGTNFTAGAVYRASGEPYLESQAFVDVCNWIRQNTRDSALVAYSSSEKMYLCSGRRTPLSLSTMPVSLNARDHETVIQAIYSDADYVIVNLLDRDEQLTDSEPLDWVRTPFLNPVVTEDVEHFRLLFKSGTQGQLRVYEVNKSESGGRR